jgi:hypothetical protein
MKFPEMDQTWKASLTEIGAISINAGFCTEIEDLPEIHS